jgi:anti-anti-sigma factor
VTGAPPLRVALSGDIDVDNALAIGEMLCGYLAETTSKVLVVDCAGVTFVESRGLAMMARVQRQAAEGGITLTWRQLSEAVLRVVRIAGLEEYLDIQA